MTKLILGDCLEKLNDIDDSSIHLLCTSPPYNVSLGDNKYNKSPYDLYQDNKEHWEYINWLKEVFTLVYNKLIYSGRVVINIGDGKNGAVPTHSDIIQFMKEIGYIPYTHLIWDKSQVGNRTSWGSYLSPSCPSFPTPFEHILVFSKGQKKRINPGITDLTKEEFIEWSLALWKFPPETNMKKLGHPAAFPLSLPIRCIKMFSYIGDVVLDPFCGIGTTGVACKMLNREFIGIDISENYLEAARSRIENQ